MRAVALLGVLALAGRVAADTLCLADGRIFDGVKLERGTDAVRILFEHGVVSVPMSRVTACVIPGDPGFEPRTDEERKRIADGFVLYKGKWVKPQERERILAKLVEQQRAAVAAMKASREWRTRHQEGTKDFAYEYTVPQNVFKPLEGKMKAFLDALSKRWKIRKASDLGPLKVRAFADPDDFYQITGVPRGVLAFFKPFDAPYELDFYYDRIDPRGTETDMFHEFGHYLHKLIDTDFFYPHFPGEAVAEYFSPAAYDVERDRLTLVHEVLEGRLAEVQLDIKEGDWVGLEELVRGGDERNYHDYTWGWSLVYFLMGKPDTAKAFDEFFVGLARDKSLRRVQASVGAGTRYKAVEGATIWEYFRKCLGLKTDADVAALEKAWHACIRDELAVTSSRGLAEAARSSLYHGRPQLAKRFLKEATEADGAIAATFYLYGQVLARLDEDQEARVQWRRAIELDPLTVDYYVALGVSVVEDEACTAEEKDEGKRLLRLAKEIEPDNFYLERNLERLLKR